MMEKYYYISYKLLFVELFLIHIPIAISTLSFTYPTAVTLQNGNIFVIHQTGISICDPSYSTIIEDIYVFPSGKQISAPDILSRVSISQFLDGYIVSAIIDKIYIFNSEGKLETTSTSLMNENINIFISVDEIFLDKYYYYLAGFIYDNSIYLNYYYYNSTNKNNVLHSSATGLKDRKYGNYYVIKNKGLSCQILNYQNSDSIVCATYVYDSYNSNNYKYYLAISYLSYNKDTKLITYKQNTLYYPWNEIMCIKSTYGHERSKAFFCLYFSSGEVNCFLFDIQADHSTLYYYKIDYDYCKTEFYSLKVYYFPETEKYGVSCITKTGKVQSIIYDKNMEKSYDTIS